MSDRRYYLSNFTKEQLAEMCAAEDARTDGQVHLAYVLQAENAKLRELVRDMMGFFEDGDWCVRCERARDCQAQEQYEDDCLMRFVFRDRMSELGVETDV